MACTIEEYIAWFEIRSNTLVHIEIIFERNVVFDRAQLNLILLSVTYLLSGEIEGPGPAKDIGVAAGRSSFNKCSSVHTPIMWELDVTTVLLTVFIESPCCTSILLSPKTNLLQDAFPCSHRVLSDLLLHFLSAA